MKSGDGAFRVAFGGGKPPKKGVLTAIEEMAGRPSRIYLPEPPGDTTPLVKIGSSDPEDDSRYQVTGEIARGGVGIIYRGRDRDLGRDVALKVLRPEHAESPEVVERFIEEAQVGAQLQHPGIVPVYGMGLQADDRPYFSMKLIKGRTLAALLNERKDPGQERRRFLRIFEQICQTMAYAHSRGVIHRDLKPSNIMVGSYGEVMVVDWGFAKVLGRSEPEREDSPETIVATVRSTEGSASVSGSVMGTPAYMPPEQALGQVERLDERADVFALGAILAHVLTDKPPYTGKGNDALVQAAQARLDDCYERLDECGADETLVDLVRRCLSPVSEDRPQDAAVLAEEIDTHINAVERRAREAQLAAIEQTEALAREQRRAMWARRTNCTTLTIAAVVLLAVGALSFLYVQRGDERDARLAKVLPAVDRALDEVAEHKAAGRWYEAEAAAEKASSLANGTPAESRVRDVVATVREGKQRADAHAETLREEEAFLTRIRDLIDRLDRGIIDGYRFDPDMRQAFEEFGLDPAAPKRSVHSGPALLDLVDRWFNWRISSNVYFGTDPKELLVLAEFLDTDSLRRRMRAAVAEHRRGDLIQLADEIDIATCPPDRWVVLVHFLLNAGAPYEAAQLVKVAQEQYPGHFLVQDAARVAYSHVGMLAESHRAALAEATISNSEFAWRMVAHTANSRSRWEDALTAIRRDKGGGASRLEFHYLRQLGRLDAEIERRRSEFENSPNDKRLRRRLAAVLSAAGRHGEALEILCVAAPFDDTGGWSDLAVVQTRNRDWAAALESYAKCLRVDPKHRSTMLMIARSLGSVLSVDHTPAQAQEWIAEHAAGLLDAPTLAQLFTGMSATLKGMLHQPDRMYGESLKAAELAVKHAPSVGQFQANLGWALIRNDRHDEALPVLGKAVALAPNNSDIRATFGDALFRANRTREAISSYKYAIESSGFAFGAAGRLGSVARQVPERHDEIVSFARSFADRYPDFVRPQNVAGWILHYCGEHEAALLYADRALALSKEDGNAIFSRAATLYALGRDDEAIRVWREILATRPADPNPRAKLAFALLKQGNVEAASREFEQSFRDGYAGRGYMERNLAFCWIQSHPEEELVALRKELPWFNATYSMAHLCWGAAEWHFEHGQVDECLRLMKKGLDVDPNYPGVRASYGLLLAVLHRYEEAEECAGTSPFKGDTTPLWIARGLGRFDRVTPEYRKLLSERLVWAGGTIKAQLAKLASLRRIVEECDELAARESELEQIAAIEKKAATSMDALWYARLCFWKKRYGAAAHWFQEAFAKDPGLAEDFDAQHRYLAARAAAESGQWELAERWVAEEREAWKKHPREGGYQTIDRKPRPWMIERVLAGRPN